MKFNALLSVFACIFIALAGQVHSQTSGGFNDLFSDEPEFLPVDEAFQFDFTQKDDQLTLTWQIAEGYYLYKKQFKTAVKDAEIGTPRFPESVQIEDEYYGISDVFFNQVSVKYPIIHSVEDGVVKIRYQGCAEAGLCYPPTTKVVYLSEVSGNSLSETMATESDTTPASAPVSQQFELANLLSSDKSLAVLLGIFLLLGIGLAFTPCVFPMYPILSGIIVGQGKQIRASKALWLSFVYVQGMAITYSLLGLVVASVGVQFQAALQHPAILVTFTVIFIVLALVMFGTWELQLPSRWQEKLNGLSNQQKAGNVAGVFLMGVISGLVASPCTTAPLTGILLYIAQSGDLILGFTALYALSLGMGIPLMLFGVTGGKLLPKAGSWMNVVKVAFGFMMLAVALIFIERMIIQWWTELIWSALGLATFAYFYTMNQNTELTFMKGVRNLTILLGFILSFLWGYHTLSQQWQLSQGSTNTPSTSSYQVKHPPFMKVKDLDDFQQKLQTANQQGKSVMVDLYADWCVACKEFEKYTFTDVRVINSLEDTVWMQIDLTDNTPTNIAFQEHFDILGLPTILFFDESGNELTAGRVTGFMKAEPFANHVNAILK
ncbi:protein-disulfide reductase DsbD [Aestuariibacter sp. AA17]|uniref:Thiol:disulfide interchange protein DsbD n=1 Tax=Fluctibacter corallii TaxID=2984329 RepID=A0ABT3AC88_9ALTE|nr:protein-disulfide reductase DsbD [Aestuariibacter sp. AA17]MCV2886286.1 protein-disulfide reductase DsbD [Aestuariibacter sp. AA17]